MNFNSRSNKHHCNPTLVFNESAGSKEDYVPHLNTVPVVRHPNLLAETPTLAICFICSESLQHQHLVSQPQQDSVD